MNIYRSGLLLLLFLSTAQAHATLIQRDWVKNSGDGLLTYDSKTGFEWLDLTQSLNLNRYDVALELQAGRKFDGFTFAEAEDVDRLVFDAGFLSAYGSTSLENVTAVKLLQSLLGTTYVGNLGDGATTSQSLGITSGTAPEPNYGFTSSGVAITIITKGRSCKSASGCGSVAHSHGDPLTRAIEMGAFLYRQPSEIPVPDTGSLFGLGLAVLAFQTQRRKVLRKS